MFRDPGSEPPRAGKSALRVAFGLIVSIGLHALLFAAPRPPEEAPPGQPIELEILHLEEEEPAEPPPVDDAPRHRESVAPSGSRAGGGGGEAHASGAEGLDAAEDEGGGVPGDPRAPGVAYRKLDLRAPVEVPEAKEINPIDEMMTEFRAQRRATVGKQRYWSEVGERLERDFEVSKELLAGEGRGLAPGLLRGLKSWARQARAYGATGNPYGDDPMAPGGQGVAARGMPGIDAGLLPYEGVSEASIFTKHLVTHVMVVQREEGGLDHVRVGRSSGSPAFDRQALAAARKLAERTLEAPPDGTQTLWEFSATLRTTPPMPVAGCALGPDFLPERCFYPLSQHLTRRVRLLAVYTADEEPEF